MTAAVVLGTVAALASNRNATKTPTAPPAKDSSVGIGGAAPAPTPVPGGAGPTPAPAPAGSVVPAGPSWASEPPLSTLTTSQRVQRLAAFLKQQQPVYWVPRPAECDKFAAALVMAAELERYPLDLLVGHAWAEGALKPYMTPTAGSGAYGPTQVTRISCADVGMAYPPKDVLTACTVTIRQLRVLARRHSEASGSFTNALRIYGLGYGNFQQFQRYGCTGKPCERPLSVWRHECGCSGSGNRYTWKVNAMARKAGAAGLHTRPWATWRAP